MTQKIKNENPAIKMLPGFIATLSLFFQVYGLYAIVAVSGRGLAQVSAKKRMLDLRWL
jgi:hypothetical protein